MSKYMVAEYELRPDKLDDCVMVINRFVQAVRTNEPKVLHYEAYRRGRTLHFVHFMEFADDAAEIAHKDMPHTRQFVADLYPCCAKQPVFTDLFSIGAPAGHAS
jgi:quinol monooxygenase YgiN